MTAMLHATCVALGGRGVLLTGRPGSGKSDLALRLIDRGAVLVGDDGIALEAADGRLIARAGPHIGGQIEIRGIGIVEMPSLAAAPVALAIALDAAVPRMADDPPATRSFAGVAIPVLALDPFEGSAPIKVEQALLLYGLPA